MRAAATAVILGLTGCADPGGSARPDREPLASDTASFGTWSYPSTGPTGGLTGQVVDEAGEPLVGVRLAACAAFCALTDTDPAGAFVFDALPARPHAFHAVVSKDSGWSQPMVPVDVREGEQREIALVVPRLAPPVQVEGAAQVLPELTLRFSPGSVSRWNEPVTEVAAVAAPATGHPPLDGLPGEVLAVYYLAPYDAEVEPPATIAVSDGWELPDGAVVRAWVASYDEAAWLPAGALSRAGERVEGGAVPVLSTLVLTRE